MPQNFRETQRAPRSCIPCTRRKVKCSKTIPCEQCIQRADVAACTREIVKVGGKVTVAVDSEGQQCDALRSSNLIRENASLKIRIKQLELALARPELTRLERLASEPAPAIPESLESPKKLMSDFQTQTFGLLTEPASESSQSKRFLDSSVKFLLPGRQWSKIIVDFSLMQLGWVHCAVEETTFMKEHDEFWQGLVEESQECLTNHGWIAVYLSILAAGVYFINEAEIHDIQLLYEILSSQPPSEVFLLGKNPARLCRAWYEAALRELELADFTRKPALSTIQTVAILNILHKNLGESSREYILHGMAVNIARLIGIDHLGTEKMKTAIADPNRAQRNMQRRLWWTLVICDWMTIKSRPISIHPDSFTTTLESDHDESDSPSPFEYHKVMARIAAMIRIQVTSVRDWTPAILQASFEDLDRVLDSFPIHLRCYESADGARNDLHDNNSEPYWNTLQRNLALNCVDSWRISLYVATIPQMLDLIDPTKHADFPNGVPLARRILHRIYKNPNLRLLKFWAVNSAIVSAGIFLALDIICFQKYRSASEVAEEKELVTLSFQMLEQSSAETRHGGILVLRRLSHLYEIVLPALFRKIDRNALARILKLVAVPRLWDSLPDTDATIRFVFQDSQSIGDGGVSAQYVYSQPLVSDFTPLVTQHEMQGALPQGGTLEAWDLFSILGEEDMTPLLAQLLPAADIIDT
ncbi:hypothetical protein F1880_005736 [Penicillium rolfsii]|nr:hypothetical protein F1880_005736 [Penicillium rolfsii]